MRLLADDTESFQLERPDGVVLTIPKRGLHREVQAHIRGLEKAEGYACGGEVKGYAEGGEVVPVTGVPELDQMRADLSGYAPANLAVPEAPVTIGSAGLTGAVANVGDPLGDGSTSVEEHQAKVAASESPDRIPVPARVGSLAQYAGAGAPAPQPAAPPIQWSDPYASSIDALQRSAGAAQGATAQQGVAMADAARAQAEEMERRLAAESERQKAWEASQAEITNEIKATENDLRGAKIDPQRLWNSKGSSEKARALIGIILGGIGAGMTGGPNQALALVERQVDLDIDAQRAEMGKKSNLLSMLYQRFGSLQQAEQMARAYKLTEMKTAIDAAALRASGPIEIAKARALSAQIGMQLAQTVQPLVVQQAQMKLQIQMMNQLTGGRGYMQGGAKPPPPTLAMSDPAAYQKDLNDRTVPGPMPGSPPALAYDAESAKQARTRLLAADTLEKTIDSMDAVAKQVGLAPDAKAQQYRQYRQLAAGEFAKMLGGSANPEAMSEFADMFPDRIDLFLGRGNAAAKHFLQTTRAGIYRAFAGVEPSTLAGVMPKVR